MDYRTEDIIIREGLDKVAALNIAIAKLEQVNPANPIITKAFVKSIVCDAYLEGWMAMERGVGGVGA